MACKTSCVALLAEGVDRNILADLMVALGRESPSSRRAWIEIVVAQDRIDHGHRRPPRGGRG